MAEPVVVVTTVTDSREAADQIANSVVADRLAACAQVSGPLTSTYRWQGRVESAQEWRVDAKCLASNADLLVGAIRAAHTYSVPEIVVTPVLGGHEPYLEWVAAETTPPRSV